MAVPMKSTVFGVVTPCSLGRARRFRGTYRLNFPPDSAGFLLGLLFDREDRGDTFLRNVGLELY
jgi:hypothetical protein